MPSDQDLIDRCLAGEPSAFDGIVQRYQDVLHRHLLGLAGNHGQAEDLCQEAFIKLYRSLPRFRRGQPVAPLLFRIATNLWRDGRCRPFAVTDVETLEGEGADHVADAVMGRLDREAILSALEVVRPEYREVLSLRYDQGLSYREIAEITGVTVGTVASWLHRAMEVLRAALRSGEEVRV